MMEEVKGELLTRQLVMDYMQKRPVTTSELKQAFKEVVAASQKNKEYKVQHIS